MNTQQCVEAYKTDSVDPLWSYLFGADAGGIVGAAMAPGRLYVITGDGSLTALGDASTISPLHPVLLYAGCISDHELPVFGTSLSCGSTFSGKPALHRQYHLFA